MKIDLLKKITIILMVILVIEVIYIGYYMVYKNKESLYFDGINSIQEDGNSYVTVGSNNDNDNYYEKAKISKYNIKKEKTFEKLYNVGYNSVFFGVALDGKDIIAVGSYEKTKKDHDDSVRKALIVKYDSSGEIVFEEDFSMLDNSKFTSVYVLDDGYLVVGQSVYKSTSVGSKLGGAIMNKYDKNGKLIWSQNYGNNKVAIFNDLIVVDGNIYAVGGDENHLGIICKYDMNGNFISSNNYEYTDDIGFSGIVTYDDKIYICGSYKGLKDTSNAMIVMYDLDCNYIKEVIYKNRGDIRYNRLIMDDLNRIIVIGIIATKKNGNETTVDNLNYDGLIGKYTSDQEEVSVVTYGDDRDDYFTDIKVVDNNYLIVGYSSYEDGSYLSKFIRYSDALKLLGVD